MNYDSEERLDKFFKILEAQGNKSIFIDNCHIRYCDYLVDTFFIYHFIDTSTITNPRTSIENDLYNYKINKHKLYDDLKEYIIEKYPERCI